jgi:hypothetical protein
MLRTASAASDAYPRQNGLAVALRELGRIERTLFILDWLQSVDLRRRVRTGLNKGKARNALARAVFFYRLGEIRDRNFEQQQYRASGLTLATAAIALWNTIYLERATNALHKNGHAFDPALRKHLSPLGWEQKHLDFAQLMDCRQSGSYPSTFSVSAKSPMNSFTGTPLLQLLIELSDTRASGAFYITLKWQSDPSPPCPCRHRCHDRHHLPLLALLAFAVEGTSSRTILFSRRSRRRQRSRHSLQ